MKMRKAAAHMSANKPKAKIAPALSWQTGVLCVAALTTLVWSPGWIPAAALFGALMLEFFPDSTDDEKDNSSAFDMFAIGIAFFVIELAVWALQYRQEIHFRNVIFPGEDAPYDLRGVFFGWLLLFSSLARKLRNLFNGDPKLDD